MKQRCTDILDRKQLSQLQIAITRERWFGSKTRQLERVDFYDCASGMPGDSLFIPAILKFTFSDGGTELYHVPIAISENSESENNSWLTFSKEDKNYSVGDALGHAGYIRSWLEAAKHSSGICFLSGRVEFETTPEFEQLNIDFNDEISPMGREQSNSSFLIGRRAVYKSFRKLNSGVNPDFEMPRFVAERSKRKIVPAPLAYCRYVGGGEYSLGCLSEFVENEGDCWSCLTSRIASLIREGVTKPDSEVAGTVEELAAVTSELHNTLSAGTGTADFEPEPVTEADIGRWISEFESVRADALATLRAGMPLPDGQTNILAGKVASLSAEGNRRAGDLRNAIASLLKGRKYKIRIHGDYHLGQVLKSGKSFTVIDFEGEPMRSLEERRKRHCALRDVSGMLRSIDYAFAYAAMAEGKDASAVTEMSLLCQKIFTDAYWKNYSPVCEYLPDTGSDAARAIGFFMLEKAYYELSYELNNRPGWAGIPLNAILSNAEAGAGN
ncbi:MAG: hypothetical protein M1442_01885 [Candidatus Thermoplasmatota archaeon]|nr:hypothetical protein [Candidatus Thermoplasmatota archaeon]